MFLTRLSLAIQQTKSEKADEQLNYLEKLISQRDASEEESAATKEDIQQTRQLIVKIMKNKEVLIVLDNCEDPLEDDCDCFVQLLDYFLDEIPALKILLTSRKYINKLEHNKETPYHLYSLTPQASLKLLLEKAPRMISNSEIAELLSYKVPDNHPIYQHFPTLNVSDTTLSNHPFTLMLGGHPQAISLAAPMLEHQTLTELFQQLLDSNIMDALGSEEKQSYTSLRLSLDISICNIRKTKPEALDLFMLIGLLPGGIKQPDLPLLYESSDLKYHKDQLIRASLLVYRPAENMLTLLPFMNTRAFELLEQDPAKKTEFHLKCCKFYKEFCVKFLEKMNMNKFSLGDLVEAESNIWSCIYRGINRKKDNYEYDSEEEESDGFSDIMQANTMNNVDLMALKDMGLKPKSSVTNVFASAGFPVKVTTEKRQPTIQEEEEFADGMEDLDDELLGIKMNIKNITKQKSQAKPSKSSMALNAKNTSLSKKISTIAKQNSIGSFMRLKTDVNSAGKMQKLSKSLNQFINPINETQFQTEEMLVMYYISIVIRLLKLSDGLKAINEYKKKPGLSRRAQAHLSKFQGVLSMLSEKKDHKEAKKHFDDALNLFYKIGSSKGRAICRLALVRVQYEIELAKDEPDRNLKNLISITEKAKSQFSKIGYKLGVDRADLYIKLFEKKVGGDDVQHFQKFIKFKTLKRNHIESIKATDALLEQNILNNEDIRLFVEIVEEEVDSKLDVRKFNSISLNRQSPNRHSLNLNKKRLSSVHNSNSVLSLTSKTNKFRSPKTKFFKTKKKVLPKMKYAHTPLRFRFKKGEVITLKNAASLMSTESVSMSD